MPAPGTHPKYAKTNAKHHVERPRMRPWYPDIEGTPELSASYRNLQMYWMRVIPGYRDEIKAALDEVAKAADKRAQKIEQGQRTEWGERLSAALKRQEEREDQLERLAGY